MNATGYISKVVPEEGFYAFIPFPDTYLLDRRQVTEVGVEIQDGRTISPRERSKIYATLRDISEYTGHTVPELKDYFKIEYMIRTGCDWFSLSKKENKKGDDYSVAAFKIAEPLNPEYRSKSRAYRETIKSFVAAGADMAQEFVEVDGGESPLDVFVETGEVKEAF